MAFDLEKFIEKSGFDPRSSHNPTAEALKLAMAELDEEEAKQKKEQAKSNLIELKKLWNQKDELQKKFQKEVSKIDEAMEKMGKRICGILSNSPPPVEEEKQEQAA